MARGHRRRAGGSTFFQQTYSIYKLFLTKSGHDISGWLITLFIGGFLIHLLDAFTCVGIGYFDDPYDCSVYHLCTTGSHRTIACPAGTLWNTKTEQCNWAGGVDCGSKWKPEFTQTTPKPTGTTEIWTNFTCPADGFFADPWDCKTYHYCLEKKPKTFKCKGGLWYDPKQSNCDWPEKVECAAAPPTTPSTEGSTSSTVPTTTVWSAISCPEFTSGFFPDPYDCSIYHWCAMGKDKIIACQPGLFYDQSRGTCDWPAKVTCEHKCPGPDSDAYGLILNFIDNENCGRFYECQLNGILKLQQCAYPQQWSVETRKCEDYRMVKCGNRKAAKYPCDYDTSPLCSLKPTCEGKFDGIYPDLKRRKCTWHYECRDERTIMHRRCRKGFRFNEQIGRCARANKVRCAGCSIAPSSLLSAALILLLFSKFLSLDS